MNTESSRRADDHLEIEAALRREIDDLTATLKAIRTGGVDAVIIAGTDGDEVYLLSSADRPYRAIVEKMGDGAATVSERGILLYANKRFAELLRHDRTRLVGRDFSDVLQVGEAATLDDLLSTPPGVTTRSEQLTIVHPDGSTTPVLASVTGLDLEGSVVRCLNLADLTSTVEAEEHRAHERAAERERYEELFESGVVGITRTTPDGQILQCNRAAARMYGFDSPEEFIAQTPDLNALFANSHREPFSFASEQDQAAQPGEGWLTRRDGSKLLVRGGATAFRNPEGEVTEYLAHFVDVTARDRFEQEARENLAHYQASRQRVDHLMALTPAVIFWIEEADGWTPTFMSGNVEDLLGYPEGRFREGVAFWHEIVYPDDWALLAPKRTALSAGRHQSEYRFRHGDGSLRWLNEQLIVVPSDGAEPEEIIGSWTDITELRATTEALQLADQQLQELMAQLSTAHEDERKHLSRELHDNLGQILTSASLFAKAASLDLPPERREVHDRVRGLIDDALAATRSLAWTLHRSEQSDALEGRLQQLVDDVSSVNATKLDLEFRGHGRSLSVGVESVVFRIVQEALTNVVRHAKARHAWVIVTVTGGQVGGVVRDDGVGFDAQSTATRHGGTRARTGRHAEDRLPTWMGDHGAIQSRRSPGRPVNTQPRPLRVLLIDDHAVVRQGVQMLLEREGEFVVSREAATLREAVAPGEDPDIVLTDLILATEQGEKLIEALRNRYPTTPILVLSMVDHPVEVRAALSAGADGYLLKESAAEELIQAVRRVASGEGYLQPSLGAAIARQSDLRNPAGFAIALTEREREVLQLLVLGHTNKQMAQMLGVSMRTVEAHRASLLRIVGVKTRAELIRFALDAGLVRLS